MNRTEAVWAKILLLALGQPLETFVVEVVNDEPEGIPCASDVGPTLWLGKFILHPLNWDQFGTLIVLGRTVARCGFKLNPERRDILQFCFG